MSYVEDVSRALVDVAGGMTAAQVAARSGVCRESVMRVLRGEAVRHDVLDRLWFWAMGGAR